MARVDVSFEIQGIAPLIQDNPDGPEKLPANPSQIYGQKPDDGWRKKVYLYDDKLGHPAKAFKMMLMEAGRTMVGKKKSEKMKFPIKHGLFMEGDGLIFTNRTESDGPYTDHPRVRAGDRLTQILPMFDTGWRLKGKFWFDDESITLDRVKAITDRGGERFGLGKCRPDFGRFIVVSFDTLNGANGKKKK